MEILNFLGNSVYVWMGILFCCYAYFYATKIRKYTKTIKELNEKLLIYDDNNSDDEFENVIEIFKNCPPTIKNDWNLYEKTLVKHNIDGKHHIYSTSESGDYFNFATVTADIDTAFWQNCGSIFTGLGILGTFIGLTAGLINLNMSSTDIAVLRDGIGDLLGGMKTAFLTSLAGILWALAFNIIHKNLCDRLLKHIAILVDKIESLYHRRNSEQFLLDILTENKKAADQLMEFNSDLAVSIGDSVSNNFKESLAPILNNLLTAITELNTSGSKALSDSLQEKTGEQLSNFAMTLENMSNILKRIVENSENVSSTSNEKLQQTINTLSDKLQKVTDYMVEKNNASMKNTTDEMKVLLEQYKDTFEKITKSASGTNKQMKDTFESALMTAQTSVNKQSENLLLILGGLEATTNKIKSVMESAQDTALAFEGAAEPVKNASESLKKHVVSIEEIYNKTNDRIANNLIVLSRNVEQTNRNAQAIQKGELSAQENWHAYANSFNGVSGEVENTFEKLQQGILQYQKAMRDGNNEMLRTYDDKIGTSINKMSTMLEELNDTLESFEDYLGKRK